MYKVIEANIFQTSKVMVHIWREILTRKSEWIHFKIDLHFTLNEIILVLELKFLLKRMDFSLLFKISL